jgi:O-antigen/teichoic acid export membrane protein
MIELEAEETLEPRRGSFLGNVNVVMITYVLDGALAFATGIILARALGPEGRGAYGLFVVSAAFGQLLLGLGVGNATIYYMNKGEFTLKDLVSAAHVMVVFALTVTAIIVSAIAPWAAGDISGVSPWLLILAVPVLLHWNLMRMILQGQSRFLALGVTTIAQQAILVTVVAVLAARGDPTPAQAAWCLIGATATAAVLGLTLVGLRHVDLGQVVRPRIQTLKKLAGFGVQGEAGNILQLLNYRLDQYILGAIVGLSGVGVYAVGASMTEAIFIMANSVALVLLPRLTADEDEAYWMAPLAARNTMMIAALGAVALAIVAPVLVPLAFGDSYEDSVQALWLLLPGTVALAGSKVLTSYIFSRGRPLLNTGITAVALVVTVTLDLILIPVFEVNGAALASSIAYVVHFAAALAVYSRLSGRSPLVAVIPGRDDLHLYTDAWRNMTARLSRRDRRPSEA